MWAKICLKNNKFACIHMSNSISFRPMNKEQSKHRDIEQPDEVMDTNQKCNIILKIFYQAVWTINISSHIFKWYLQASK